MRVKKYFDFLKNIRKKREPSLETLDSRMENIDNWRYQKYLLNNLKSWLLALDSEISF